MQTRLLTAFVRVRCLAVRSRLLWARSSLTLIFLAAIAAIAQAAARTQTAAPPHNSAINWSSFLSRSDLVWQRLPDDWSRGAFTGNGVMGAMTYIDKGVISWELGRVDVADRQDSPYPMTASPRLPIGFLRWQGCPAPSGDLRLDLWNAELRGEISSETARPTKMRSWVHATMPLIGIEVQRGGCEGQFEIDPAEAKTSEPQDSKRARAIRPNPIVERFAKGARKYVVQTLSNGGAYATVSETIELAAARVVFVTIQVSQTRDDVIKLADRALSHAGRTGFDSLTLSHRIWWHGYYPSSFVALPDAQLESFYWIQMYKLASATRANGDVIDTLGPWYHTTPWPGLWWNLNVQLSYWPVYTANRLALGESLINALKRHKSELRQNAQPHPGMAIGRTSGRDLRSPLSKIDRTEAVSEDAPREHGNLMWALHNVWLHYRHTFDPALQRELISLLSEATAYYLDVLKPGADGRLHMPRSLSPEYPEPAADTNYDLSLLRWGLNTLLDPANAGLSPVASRQLWASARQRLAPFPTDKNGYMIGANTPLAQSHRHFSHMLMIYPLGLVSPDNPEDRELIKRSLAHWIGFRGGLEGYSYVVAAAIAARLGEGDTALAHLKDLIRQYVRRNTMYTEAGPVIETPLAAAQSIHELLLQSRDDSIFVFPALPSSWQDVRFDDLRAQGAFLVSAERRAGVTTSVRVRSLAGKPCRLRLPKGDNLMPTSGRSNRWKKATDGAFELSLRKGESLQFLPEDSAHTSAPANTNSYPSDRSPVNPFGISKHNAWYKAAPMSHEPAASRTATPSAVDATGAITTWELLDADIPTAFSQNGWEEIMWAHTSCDPCASEVQTWTGQRWAGWTTVQTKNGCIDFKASLPKSGEKDAIAYLRTSVLSATDRQVMMRIGTNDQGRVWIWPQSMQPADTHSIYVNTGGAKMGRNAKEVKVQLKKGLNHLFIKTINIGAGWGACLHMNGAREIPAVK